ncbi:MAG: pyruvate formate lyase family protein [Dehalococcoidia bacterium]|nr:pyruvate formate lyase family protein [Dehalococcoidia bacterium]
MATITGPAVRERTRDSFDENRETIFRRFKNVPYAPDTGVSSTELQELADAYLLEHPAEPRIVQKANIFRLALTQGRIYVDPLDWFAEKVGHGDILRKLTHGSRDVESSDSGSWLEEAATGPLVAGTEWFDRARAHGVTSGPRSGLDLGHISPGWDTLLEKGLSGLLEDAARSRASLGDAITGEQDAFYRALEIVYNAAIEFAGRLSALAESTAVAEKDHPERVVRLRAIASALSNVPANPPRTLHEALQFMWLMHELIEMEGENVRSMGQFDRTLYPFYMADVEAGRITVDHARELIKFFWHKWYCGTEGAANGKNFVFGGQYPDGSEITNELTFLALEAYEELNTPDPKLSVRYLPDSPERLYERVADLIRNGNNSFVLMNDPPAVEALIKRGKTPEDARIYLPIGCYEPAVEGKEVACTMNVTVSLAKPLELALNDGVDPRTGVRVGSTTGDPLDFSTYDDLLSAYMAQLDYVLDNSSKYIAQAEREWPRINPAPFISGTIDDCIPSGTDISAGGAHYNTVGFVGAGLANAADSLYALKQTVFDDGRFTMAEVVEVTRAGFADRETMRLYLRNRVPKWGNNHSGVDEVAKGIADHFCSAVHSFTNGRGGGCQAALFTLTAALGFGTLTGATPDGRRAYESLAPGVGATYGLDRDGVTGLINSVTKLDFTETPNGSVLDVTLHPTAVAGEEGLHAFVGLIKTFFAQGGYAIQFNVMDAETLRDAQRHPEKYASLQVRVTGWSVYFTTLTRREQDQYIARIAHGA